MTRGYVASPPSVLLEAAASRFAVIVSCFQLYQSEIELYIHIRAFCIMAMITPRLHPTKFINQLKLTLLIRFSVSVSVSDHQPNFLYHS